MASTFQDRLVTELRLAGATTMEEANAVLQEYLPRFNARFSVAAEQPEQAYRPVPADLSLTETVSIRHTLARDNTVAKLLPAMPVSSAGTGRRGAEYQGEAVDFQLNLPQVGRRHRPLPSADKRETASGLASSHLDEASSWDLDSSVEKRAKARKDRQGSGRKRKTGAPPVAPHTYSHPRPVGRRCSRRKAGDSPCGSPGNWACPATPGKYLKDSPPTKLGRARLAEQIAADYMVHFRFSIRVT